MAKYHHSSLLSVLLWIGIGTNTVYAQVTLDGTLSTTVSSTDNLNFTIENGDRAGNNLFHSFDDFSVPTNGSAIFNNTIDIENIFSRVTGSNASSIDGLIQANGTANLFLLNPNGIQFGSGASLNLGGSFFASTADTFLFDDGTTFSTTDTSPSPLLSVNVPTGIQWNQATSNPITVQDSTLAVTTGSSLTLVGGDVTLSGSTLTAPGGQVTLGGLSTSGTVDLNSMQPRFPDGVSRTDITLSDISGVNVVDGGNGSIEVQANNLTLSGSSELKAGLTEGVGAVEAVAGDIVINATGDMVMGDRSLIANDLATDALGNGGNIEITTGSLTLTGGSRIQTVTNTSGASGAISVNADGTIDISGFTNDGLFSGILSQSAIETSGAGGNITINSPQDTLTLSERGFIGTLTGSSNNGGGIEINVNALVLETGGQIVTATTNLGNAGDILINATESVTFSGESRDFVPNPFLDLVTLELDDLDFTTEENANVAESGVDGIPYVSVERTPDQIISGTTVLASATDEVTYYSFGVVAEDSRVVLDIDGGFTGEDGSVDTNIFLFNQGTGELVDNNDDSEAAAGGDGSIEVFSTFTTDSLIDTTVSDPGFYVLGVGAFPSGAANNELIEGTSPQVGETYTLHASIENQGTDGISLPVDPFNPDNFNPNIDATSGLFSDTSGGGRGGSLTINTGELVMSDRAQLSAQTTDMGEGGNITLQVNDTISINTSALIKNITEGSGNAGTIQIETEQLTNNGRISSATHSSGNAGSISITAEESVILSADVDNDVGGLIFSDVESDATGDGGNIDVETPILQLLNGSQFSAGTAGQGNAGEIRVVATTVEVRDYLGPFPSGILVRAEGAGNGGTITIEAEQLRLIDGGILDSLTVGTGNAGNIVVQASELVEIRGIDGSGFTSGIVASGEVIGQVLNEGIGSSGNILIETVQLDVDQGRILSTAAGAGDAGDITIRATDITLRDSVVPPLGTGGIAVSVDPEATGQGGNLLIEAGSLHIFDGGEIKASTFGTGDGGNIILNIDEIDVSGFSERGTPSLITASSETDANAGSISITGEQLTVGNGGEISVSGQGLGDAGNLSIVANQLLLSNGGTIQAEVSNGSQGNIFLTANEFLILDQESLISANATNTATGGNIAIASPLIVGLNNSDIAANAVQGDGGNIQINTQSLLGLQFRDRLTDGNDITASSQFGLSGTVAINDFTTDPDSGLVELPSGLVDSSDQIAKGCSSNQGNTFIATGRGGIAASPTELMDGDRAWVDTRDLSAFLSNGDNVGLYVHGKYGSSDSNPVAASQDITLTEATTWHTNADGHIELATVHVTRPDINTHVTCAAQT